MCLISKNERLVADKDVVCYKVVKKTKHLKIEVDNGRTIFGYFPLLKLLRCKYYSTVFTNPIKRREINGKKIYKSEDEELISYSDYLAKEYKTDYCYQISSGFIHVFEKLDDALSNINRFPNGTIYDLELYECIIPKGTEYYEGFTSNGKAVPGFAAKGIKFVSKIAEKQKKAIL